MAPAPALILPDSADEDATSAESEAAENPVERRSSYATVIGLYVSSVGAAIWYGRRRHVRLPDRLPVHDLVVMALATQRLARLVAKEPVTIPVRAPFTEFVGVTGPAELEERARDDSKLRHTIGELLTCPFCLGQWIGTALMAAHVLWPRPARLVSSAFAVIGVADSLQHAIGRLRQD